MSGRERLPNRRRKVSVRVTFRDESGHEQIVDAEFGFYGDGRRVGEVFLESAERGSAKAGSRIQRERHDIATMMSLLLQHGHRPEDMALRLGRLGQYPQVTFAGQTGSGPAPAGPPATIYGAVFEKAAEIERELAGAAGGDPEKNP